MKAIQRITFRKDIQILRGVAVISVILFHLDKNIFKYGYIGVDIFFVISGFVISNLVHSKISEKTFNIREFYFMRFKRIVPALVSYLLFVQVLLYFNLDFQNVIQNTKTSLYSLLFLANVHISQYLEYFTDDSSKNLVINLWSLSVEEQFYLLFPFAAIVISKYRLKNQLVFYFSIIIFSLLSINSFFYESLSFFQKIFLNYQNYLFYSPLTRVWEFTLGVLAMFINNFLLEENKILNFKRAAPPLFLLLLASIYLDLGLYNQLLRLGVANLITFLLLIIRYESDYTKNIFLNFLIFTGNISYSLYLFHQGILSGIRNHNKYTTTTGKFYTDLTDPLNLVLIISLIYLISYLNFYFVENKFRKKYKFSFNEFKIFWVLSFLTLSAAFIAINTNGYSGRHTDLLSFNQETTDFKYLNGTNYLTQDGYQCLNRSTIDTFCTFGSDDSMDKLYIVGDSMISSLVGGFLNETIQSKYTIVEVTKGGCALLLDTCDFYEGTKRYNALQGVENSIFILGGRYQNQTNLSDNSENIENNLRKTISLLTRNNNIVYLINPIPEPGINERMYYFKNQKYLTHQFRIWKDTVSQVEEIISRIDMDNFETISLEHLFCDQSYCDFKSNEYYYFLDHVHFTYYGSKFVAAEILKFIEDN